MRWRRRSSLPIYPLPTAAVFILNGTRNTIVDMVQAERTAIAVA